MKSMTGFGRAEANAEGIRCIAEASSVNRKQLEVVSVLPPELAGREREVRTLVQAAISRGMVRVGVQLEQTADSATPPRINRALALQYAGIIRGLAEEAGDPPRLDYVALLRLPGVVEEAAAGEGDPAIWDLATEAIGEALQSMVAMREEEGTHLDTDLRQRLVSVREHLACIRSLEGQVVEAQKKRLFSRLAESGIELDWDDDRLAREIGLFAERCDISEEGTRLESHFVKFEELLSSPEPAGRALDFLAQEIFRELNTITTKGSDAGIAHHAVAAKTEVERMREQIQNVE